MEVGVISIACSKLSTSTPYHLKTYELSLLGRIVPPIYIPMILFYPLNQIHTNQLSFTHVISKTGQQLKQSLSETLTRFYPLAGRVKDYLSIDCNDEGVYYVEARVTSPLFEFLNQPDLSSIHKFLPHGEDNKAEAVPGDHVAKIQLGLLWAIAKLKANATSLSVPNPTRVEAVSAILWKCMFSAIKVKPGIQKPSLITHAVNMPSRAVPPVSENLMGNSLWLATAMSPFNETQLQTLACKLREAIRKVDGDFVEEPTGR
ncbi:hypothetical protein Pint_09252 [Pistacia integerrima]|uniref:Uncharacterized protein n=1 Tax=Pistacia integerrima TaxID=434235 RepID=A0ACC0XVN3_9ROSI|nr:hypothetical protein Pint_09252 [Pistacia integerrima]